MPPRPIKNRFEIHRPYISKEEDDIIKLTAQYTARNGSEFIKSLAERENKNPIYSFLHKNHPNYPYFAQLCECYNQCIHPKQQFIQFLNKTMGNTQTLIKYSKMRANFEKDEEIQIKKNEDDLKKEELIYHTINWNDFIVVETIDFDDVIEVDHENIFLNEMIEDDDEIEKGNEFQNGIGVDKMINHLVDNVDLIQSKKKEKLLEVKQECPICHRLIPVNEMDKHMKIELSSKPKKPQQN